MDEREVRRIVRQAAESVYGVAAVVGPGLHQRLFKSLNVGDSGVAVAMGPPMSIMVDLQVAPGVPAGEVAANVAEKVRYIVGRDLGAQVAQLTVRVDGRQEGSSGAPGSPTETRTSAKP